MGRQFVEMPGAVVPVNAELLRAAADAGDSKDQPRTRAVETARRKRELAHLPADRIVMQRVIIGSERVRVAAEEFADRAGRQLAVLEGARNTFAHQRIDAGSVAGQYDAAGRIAVGSVEPSNRERMPSRRAALQPIKWEFGEGGHEFRNHP